MPSFTSGEYLNTRLAPQLLREFKNNKQDFISAIGAAPAAAISEDGLRMNKIIENVDAIINPATDFADGDVNGLSIQKGVIPWDGIRTTPTEISKEEVRAAVFNKEAEARRMHMDAVIRRRRDYCIDKLLPADDTNSNLPVLRTTGANDGSGRKRLVVDDLINFLDAVRALNPDDESNLNMVLSRKHVTDLLLDTKSNQPFRNLYFNYKNGEPIDVFGFRFFRNNSNGIYSSTGVKKAYGAAPVAGDQDASLFFYGPNTVMGYGNLMITLSPMEQDTRSAVPKMEMNIHANLMCDRKQNTLCGALVSDNVV